jgi:hypothetical protein
MFNFDQSYILCRDPLYCKFPKIPHKGPLLLPRDRHLRAILVDANVLAGIIIYSRLAAVCGSRFEEEVGERADGFGNRRQRSYSTCRLALLLVLLRENAVSSSTGYVFPGAGSIRADSSLIISSSGRGRLPAFTIIIGSNSYCMRIR